MASGKGKKKTEEEEHEEEDDGAQGSAIALPELEITDEEQAEINKSPEMKKLVAEFAEHDLELVWVAYPPRVEGGLGAQQADFLVRANELELENYALIFDVDQPQSIHANYFVNRGSPNLFVIDAEGQVQWHIIDPMHWDEGLFRGVLKRTFKSEN